MKRKFREAASKPDGLYVAASGYEMGKYHFIATEEQFLELLKACAERAHSQREGREAITLVVPDRLDHELKAGAAIRDLLVGVRVRVYDAQRV